MASESIPDIKSFALSMAKCEELSVLQPAALILLLERVHLIAEFIVSIERVAELARRFPSTFRPERKIFSTLRVDLEKARDHLRRASKLAPRQLFETLRRLPEFPVSHNESMPSVLLRGPKEGLEHSDFDVERIAAMLEAAANYARSREFAYAEIIHPTLRSSAEKKIVRNRSGKLSSSDYKESLHVLQIGEKTPAQFHWFIGQTHSSIIDFVNLFGDGHRVKNEARIIAEMFNFFFKEGRSSESVRKELERQRKTGIPDLIA
jgi:hypothetical protein